MSMKSCLNIPDPRDPSGQLEKDIDGSCISLLVSIQASFDSAGVTQLAEWQLPKLQVAGSNPVSRF
jgi:hypothetical protein